MAKIATLTLSGKSGKNYSFDVYVLDSDFPHVAGVYAVTLREQKDEDTGTHDVKYYGQAEHIDDRFDTHDKADCFKRERANCVCVHQESSEARRLAIEADLLAKEKPPCNA